MVIAVTLCLLMLFMVIAEYFRVNIIVQGVRDAVQQAVIATVNENYDDVYHSVREGYAAGWFPEGDGEWFESIDAGDIYGNLSYILGLTTDGEGYMKYAGNELEYTISDLSVHISNNAIASGQSEGYLATATLHLEVPTRFAGRVLPPVSLNLQVQAKYMVFKDHALLGLGLMLSAGEIPRIAGAFGLDTSTKANLMSAVYTAQAAVNTTRTVVQAVAK